MALCCRLGPRPSTLNILLPSPPAFAGGEGLGMRGPRRRRSTRSRLDSVLFACATPIAPSPPDPSPPETGGEGRKNVFWAVGSVGNSTHLHSRPQRGRAKTEPTPVAHSSQPHRVLSGPPQGPGLSHTSAGFQPSFGGSRLAGGNRLPVLSPAIGVPHRTDSFTRTDLRPKTPCQNAQRDPRQQPTTEH